MDFYASPVYIENLKTAISCVRDIEKLHDSSVLVTGATGLIGSFIVDMLAFYNKENDSGITIYASGRSIERLNERFSGIKNDIVFVEYDVNCVPSFGFNADYVIHAASNAYPAAFNTDPVGTVMSNVTGSYNLLEYCRKAGSRRFLFVSSGEVYGQGDVELESFSEDYSGYVDPVSPRSCYPSAKRTSETLCVSYTKQYGLDTVIVRPCHTYGPNATKSDNRANVQFVNNVLKGENIVLNSPGNQKRSYNYVADCASAILTVMLCGESANAYNIANSRAVTTIAGFARELASQTGHELIFADPDAVALAERTPVAKQVLDSRKLESLGWKGAFTLEKGIGDMLKILTGK